MVRFRDAEYQLVVKSVGSSARLLGSSQLHHLAIKPWTSQLFTHIKSVSSGKKQI